MIFEFSVDVPIVFRVCVWCSTKHYQQDVSIYILLSPASLSACVRNNRLKVIVELDSRSSNGMDRFVSLVVVRRLGRD